MTNYVRVGMCVRAENVEYKIDYKQCIVLRFSPRSLLLANFCGKLFDEKRARALVIVIQACVFRSHVFSEEKNS